MTDENVTQELEHIKSVNEKLLRLYRKADAKPVYGLCGEVEYPKTPAEIRKDV